MSKIFDKAEAKKIKLRMSEFEITNHLCKILRTDNEFTRKLDKRIDKRISDNKD